MGQFNLAGRSILIRALFLPERATPIPTLWVALTTLVPEAVDTGDDLHEPEASSYQRIAYATGEGYWTEVAPGQVVSKLAVNWPPTTDDWGEVNGWALCTESTSGTVVASGPLSRRTTILSGAKPRVVPGTLRVSLT